LGVCFLRIVLIWRELGYCSQY